jgi:putative transposase
MMERKRTPYEIMYYAVYLVFEGLSFRACSRAVEPFVKRSHVAVWQWCQEIASDNQLHKLFRLGRERIKIFAIDETGVNVAGAEAYLFVAYEPFVNRILGLYFAWNPNSISVEMFLKDLVRKYGRHQVWTDGADWYPPACQSMNLKHHVYMHGSWLWKVMERQMEKLKDRTESFDDLFPCRSHGTRCKLNHVFNWLNLFWLHHQPGYQSLIRGMKEAMLT